MNITHHCPRCGQSTRAEAPTGATSWNCPACGVETLIPPGAIEEGELRRCLVCPSHDLFYRKDFPQRLGLLIVIVGFAASCVAWLNYQVVLTFAILFATALADFLLFMTMGECLTCYRCGAQYRDIGGRDRHGAFDLETHERYRQQSARLSQAAASAARGSSDSAVTSDRGNA